ncbi:MAG TPA: DnaJ C-terminal domain-containing protein [Candidatus Paceibacterota bacterium]|nr:DnaJ C-terminal domain-containing protein [Candidatus Paceibacterota bacterium]
MAKNYYEILGVDKKATKDDIKKAFRKLAQQHHPDKGGDEAKFKEITEAYATLGDEKRRREYDSYGQAFAGAGPTGAGGFDFSGFQQGGVEFDFSDLFGDLGDIFGGARGGRRIRRGRDISIDVELTFKESILGARRSVLLTKVGKCEVCEGSGAKPNTEMETCKSCSGTGRIHETRNSPLGAFTSVRSCPACDGAGTVPKEKCKNCSGHGVLRKEEEVKIDIPRGIDNGEMIRMPGRGEAVKNGISGDLYVKVHVKQHPVYRKEGANLVMDLPIKLTDALLGTTVTITTIDDKTLEVKVPVMSKVEEILRLRGKGVEYEGGAGDLLIRTSVTLPKKLSSKAKRAIEELQNEGL